MRIKKAPTLAMFGVALLASRPILAHHVAAAYDVEHPVTFTGVVTAYERVTPHSQIHFDVKDLGGEDE